MLSIKKKVFASNPSSRCFFHLLFGRPPPLEPYRRGRCRCGRAGVTSARSEHPGWMGRSNKNPYYSQGTLKVLHISILGFCFDVS